MVDHTILVTINQIGLASPGSIDWNPLEFCSQKALRFGKTLEFQKRNGAIKKILAILRNQVNNDDFVSG